MSVNGEDLGTYTNVEPIKKPFTARHFSSDEGNLYEGQVVDFVPEDVQRFQLKTNEAANDRSDVERLVSALDAPDGELVSRLGEALDLDFMPWGTDGAFAVTNPGAGANPMQTVFANGRVANRLYQLPGERERFRSRLGELVDELWDEFNWIS